MRGLRGDPCQHIGQPGLRVDVVHLRGDDHAVHRRCLLAAPVRSAEEPRATAERDAPEPALGRVVGETNAAIVQEPGEGLPALEYPSWSSGFWGPISLPAQQDVCEDDELAHDGCDSDLWRLTGGDKGLILGLHVSVEADCNEGWHIEGLTKMSAAAPDKRLPLCCPESRAIGARPAKLATHLLSIVPS